MEPEIGFDAEDDCHDEQKIVFDAEDDCHDEQKIGFDAEDDCHDEQKIYDEAYAYLTSSRYTENATKADKATIRKWAKKFQVVDGILHYKLKAQL